MKYIIIILFIFSCKPEFSKDVIEKKHNNFEICVDATVEIDDFFEVFYLNKKLTKKNQFTEKKKIKKKIVGSKKNQKILLRLPDSARFYQFRIDLGNNTKHQKVSIKSIKLSYMNNNILINADLIKTFFFLNKFIDINDSNGVVKIKSNANGKDPFIISKPILIKKIELDL